MEAATTSVAAPRGPRRGSGFSQRRLAAFMVSPSIALMALVAAYPIAYAIWLSLHDYSVRVAGLSRWDGINNYTEALGSAEFWNAFRTTMIFSVSSVTL